MYLIFGFLFSIKLDLNSMSEYNIYSTIIYDYTDLWEMQIIFFYIG
jgi:hypothetical protein